MQSLTPTLITDKLLVLLRPIVGAAWREPFPMEDQLSELGVSSVGMISLMLAIEAEFGIEIPPQDINPDTFFSVSSIAALVNRLVAEPASA